jgi:hypothetical protein
MSDEIIPREWIREKGRAAFVAGKGRDEHHMNPGSPAIEEFQAGWDRAYADWAQLASDRCGVAA